MRCIGTCCACATARRRSPHRAAAVSTAPCCPSGRSCCDTSPGGVEDRLLIVNLGADLLCESIADPLVAPPRGGDWRIEWSSEEPIYGGAGMPDLWPGEGWRIPAECAIVLAPESARQHGARVRRRTA